MGSLRFRVVRSDRLPSDVAERACVVSLEGIPWRCGCEFNGRGLVITRSVSDSGYAHIPWLSPEFGQLTLSTATLVERTQPYLLTVELAR